MRWPANSPGILVEGRLIQVAVDLPRWPVFHCICGYLKSGVGLAAFNRDIIKRAAEAMSEPGIHLMGADWNLLPEVVEATGVPRRLGMQCLIPPMSTCVTAKSSNIIDFFMASNELYKLTKSVEVDKQHVPKPHRPVRLCLVPNAAEMEQLIFVTPQKLPKELPFGPLQPGEDWTIPRSIAEEAVTAALSKPVHVAERMLTMAWRKYANTMERELASRTDSTLHKPGRRGGMLEAKWVPVIRTRGKTEEPKLVAEGWEWAARNLQELSMMAAAVRAESQQLVFTEHLKTLKSENAPGAGLCGRLDAYVKVVKAMAAQCPEIGQPDAVWKEEVDEIMLEFQEGFEAARQRAKECHRAGWAAWREKGSKGGARAMHRYTRIAQEWSPALAVRSGRVSAASGYTRWRDRRDCGAVARAGEAAIRTRP